MVKHDQALSQTKPLSIYSIYDAYAGMLLGYIFEVVKDKQLAEDYLVKIFGSIALKFNDINWAETNIWCQLQRLAKNELTAFNDALKECETPDTQPAAAKLPNKYLDQMTDEQQLIFCSAYYSKKTIAELALELNKPTAYIKKTLKEAFAVIRRSNEN